MKPQVRIDEASQRVQTTLPDGSVIDAVPGTTEEDVARAHALGYEGPDALWRCTAQHDAIHSLIADAQGYEYSAALFLATHPHVTAGYLRQRAREEERTVLLVQRLLQVGLDEVLRDHGMAA